jgi:hypothetical protein
LFNFYVQIALTRTADELNKQLQAFRTGASEALKEMEVRPLFFLPATVAMPICLVSSVIDQFETRWEEVSTYQGSDLLVYRAGNNDIKLNQLIIGLKSPHSGKSSLPRRVSLVIQQRRETIYIKIWKRRSRS